MVTAFNHQPDSEHKQARPDARKLVRGSTDKNSKQNGLHKRTLEFRNARRDIWKFCLLSIYKRQV